MGFLGVAIPEAFGGAGAGLSRALRDRRGDGPRAGAGAVLLHGLSWPPRLPAAPAARRRSRHGCPRSPRARRSARWRCAEGERQSVSRKTMKLTRVRRQPQRRQDAGAGRRHRRFRHRRRAHGSTGATRDISLFLVDLKAGGVAGQGADQHRSVARPGRTHLQECAGRAAGRGRRGLGLISRGARPRRGADGVRAGRRRRPRAGDGPRLCAGAYRLRPADRLVPGDQAHARRHVRLGDAGALQLLLRRLGALDRRRRNCRKRRPRRASARRRRSSTAPRTTSRSMAAWASPGSSTATCIYRRSNAAGAQSLGSLSLLGRRADRSHARAQRGCSVRTDRLRNMNFDDTPQEAAFRAEARAWIDANAPEAI